ncbi:MAG: peptidoglycan DD-metalloendopeptidase family protein [Dysgonamonadaceae bacterium]|jgi:murein DD-endopeptidase MepM/ murein hydrolase activator NlpD|nr:peptidoglycan DD-metalloendopeptidase family protein [Dysgonamonadaceae bacterium]
MKQILIKLTFAGILSGLLFFMVPEVFAQGINPEEIKKISDEMRLVADKVNMKLGMAARDSVLMELRSDEEDEMLPADELYDGVWNNQYVKSYAGVTVPETFTIDLSSFVMPVIGKINSNFGPRRRRYHYGTDLKLQVGDTVVAAFEGRVRVKQYERRGYGNYLVLRHPNGLETVYGHLSQFLVEEGETITAGQAIALGGNTGRSTGPHLHFECRFLGIAINPAEIIDFGNACTYDDKYIFSKARSNTVSTKYVTKGNGKIIYHRIKEGDTLSVIAKRYRVSVAQLCRLNGIRTTTTLKIGRVLRCS